MRLTNTPSQPTEALGTILYAFDSRVLHEEPVEQALQVLCSQLVRLLDCRLAWVAALGPDDHLQVTAHAGTAGAFLDHAPAVLAKTAADPGPWYAALYSDQVQRYDLRTLPGGAAWRRIARTHNLPSGLALPMAANPPPGVLVLHPNGSDFPPWADDQCLLSFARHLGRSWLAARDREQVRLRTSALEAAANAVAITNRDGLIIWVNSAFTRLTGYRADEALGLHLGAMAAGRQGARQYDQAWSQVLAGQDWRGEIYTEHKNGNVYIEEQTITPVLGPDGAITHCIAIKQDISERKQREEQILYLATHDVLTDLPNRRLLAEGLGRAVLRARRGRHSALLVMDLDDFKQVNDTLGHPTGDRLLIALSRLMRSALRPGDMLARQGGDEFAVLLEDATPQVALAIAQRLQREINEFRFHESGRSFSLGVSMGIAMIDGETDADTIQGLADTALYAAKGQGKNRFVLYPIDQHQADGLTANTQWATRIRDALRENRFLLYYQPVIRLASGKPEYHEALLRLRSEQNKIILPGTFLSAAERCGLMPQVDRCVVDMAVNQLRTGQRDRVSVNLSGHGLRDDALLSYVIDRIRQSGVAGARLAFEIPEGAAIVDLVRVQDWMRELRRLGCRLALDNFGTGLSTLSFLGTLPADYIKISGSYVRNLDAGPANRAIVQAITTVAHSFGRQVIAEWVENESVAAALAELQVEHAQGFHLGRPAVP